MDDYYTFKHRKVAKRSTTANLEYFQELAHDPGGN